ncbi:MAG: hypothetical protein BWK80_02680 [Desulfobacteraceae bacterium IS3]|nr:MAG: hypothetical protein BWK80_02680 [Desulfobacteraceae bacterium IS3]
MPEPLTMADDDIITYPSRMSPIASEHTGFTTTASPVLYFYVSDPCPEEIEFTLNEEELPDPVLVTQIKGPQISGIFRIALADYNISLKPDVEYEWFVVIVLDPEERSADFLASAALKYVIPSADLVKKLADTPEDKLYSVYAAGGYWYDAFENLSRQIDAGPSDSALRTSRAELLRQVKLPSASDYDTKMAMIK